MPAVTLTTAGATELLTSGTEFTHLQFASDAIAAGDLAATTALTGSLAIVAAAEAVIGVESQFSGVDDDDTRNYVNFRTLGVWSGAPADSGSTLMAVGSTGDTTTYGDKVVNIDLHATGSLQLTPTQVANATYSTSQVVGASETRTGIVRLATDAESAAATNGGKAVPPKGLAAWWASLAIAASKIPSLPASRITSGTVAPARLPILVVTTDPTQANINAIPNGGQILVRDTTAYSP